MSTAVDAIFENGVFKPEGPVSLKDKTRVHLVIETADDKSDEDDPTGWKTVDRLIGCIEDTEPGEAIGRDHNKHLYK